jgi:hypothetical protein
MQEFEYFLETLWKKEGFATGLATQFLNFGGHMQLIAIQLQLCQNN